MITVERMSRSQLDDRVQLMASHGAPQAAAKLIAEWTAHDEQKKVKKILREIAKEQGVKASEVAAEAVQAAFKRMEEA